MNVNEYLHVMSVSGNADDNWMTPLLDQKPVQVQVHTGAAVSLISRAVHKEKLQHLMQKTAKLTLKMYTGKTVPVKELNRQK